MKKWCFVYFLVCSFVFLSNPLSAQTNDQKTIRFKKNRKVSRGQGVTILKSREINFQKKDFSLNLSKSKKTKRVYLKLKQPLTKSLHKKLKKDGITLKEYVANDTYVVEINNNKLEKLKGIFSINGFSEIDYSDKVSERLYKGNFSSHAKDGTYVKLIVRFYKDVSYDNAVSWIKSVGGIIESKKFTRTHKVNVSIHQMNIQNLAKLDVIKYVDEISPPPQTHNIDAGYLSEVFWDNDSGLFDTGYSLTGMDVNVAIKDGGAIYSHSDFGNRLTIIDNDTVSSHATHVAGTIGGELDIQNNIGGMTGDSDLYSYSFDVDGNPPQTETDFTVDYVSAIDHSVSIINNSWGHNIGWYWDETGQEWDNEDTGNSTPQSLFGDYTSDSEDIDDFIYDYFDNDALIIKSAGNDRWEGSSQTNHDGEYLTDNEGIASGHYRCIGPLSCSKNNIAIGSVGNIRNYIFYSKESSYYSSWGPTDDGRIKPDVVADGWKLNSTWDNDGYNDQPFGTSMSCPVVTGICALIHQSYKDIYEEYPTADIVKALLCNFAEDLGKKGPDFAYGFGLVNAKKCIDAVENSDSSEGGHIVTGVIAETSDYMEYQFTVGANETDNETVTLVWIDPAANPSVTNAIVNDLDITVSFSGSGYLPFYHKEYDDAPGMGSEEPTVDPTKEAKTGYNRYDTVEQILIEPDNTTGVIPAGTYTVRVSGFKVPVLNQPFAIVSSIGFDGIHYNVLRVKGQEGAWVSNQFSVLDKNPDVLMKVTYFDTSSYPSNVQYSYSTNSGTLWSDWASVTGVYEDEDCTEADNTSTSISYIKKDSVPFDNVSPYDNRVKFKLTYDGSVKESSVYVVRNDNTYYVNGLSGNDNDGKGTKLNPWETITYAIDHVVSASQVPAMVRVKEGTYSENIELEENVYLYGGYDSNWVRDIENNETIIQGDGTTHVVVGEDDSILDGFTIKGGKASLGGGIYLLQTSPTIENCTIKDNYAEDNEGSPGGAGIFAYDSEAIIRNCTIINNTTTVTEADNTGFGGGAYFHSSSILVENCIFEGNEVTTSVNSYARGGGIYLESDDSKIINSLIKSNQAYSIYNALGGGIFINEDSTSKLLGNIIILNDTAPYYFGGDGIFILDASDSAITNCTVYGNSQEGIWSYDSCCNITNTIIWNHSADDLYGTLSSSKITYCDIQDGDFDGVNGNMDDNPLFRDVSSEDFRLVNTSPCIDAGNDGAPSLDLLTKDYQGQKRIFEYDNSGSESVDIGADEYVFGFSSSSGMTMDNDGITITWESLSGITYYVEYTHDELDNDSLVWTTVDNDGVTGQATNTSWTDDGTEIIPAYDNDSIDKRFYRIFFDN